MKILKVIVKVISVIGSVLDVLALASPRYHKLNKDFNVLGAAVRKLQTHPGNTSDNMVKVIQVVDELADKFGIKDRLNKKMKKATNKIDKKLAKYGIRLNLPF